MLESLVANRAVAICFKKKQIEVAKWRLENEAPVCAARRRFRPQLPCNASQVVLAYQRAQNPKTVIAHSINEMLFREFLR